MQTGAGYYFSDRYFLSLDAKKTWLDTRARLSTVAGAVEADVNINPWIVSVGIGLRF